MLTATIDPLILTQPFGLQYLLLTSLCTMPACNLNPTTVPNTTSALRWRGSCKDAPSCFAGLAIFQLISKGLCPIETRPCKTRVLVACHGLKLQSAEIEKRNAYIRLAVGAYRFKYHSNQLNSRPISVTSDN